LPSAGTRSPSSRRGGREGRGEGGRGLQLHRYVFSALALSLALPAAAASLQLVSVRDTSLNPPAGGAGDSSVAIISADGRYVLFGSAANNLVPTTNNAPVSGLLPSVLNVFLRDRTNGTTALVSLNLAGTGGGNGDSLPAGISTNGRFALFESTANNLVAGDTNGVNDIFVRDLVSGTTELISISTNGTSGSGVSRNAVMTPDGRYVAFVSAATDLVAGDTNRLADVFVRDRDGGTTQLASAGATSTNAQSSYGPPAGSSELPDISATGRHVVFYSTATNLATGVNTSGEIYVRDLVDETTICASASARTIYQLVKGTTNVVSFSPVISADGQYVAFETRTNAALPALGSGMIFRYRISNGLIDIVHANAHVPAAAYEDIRTSSLSPDGRYLAFVANANDVSAANTVIYLWDAQDAVSTLVSADLNGAVPPNGVCKAPVVDANGRYVAFVSNATNMVADPDPVVGAFHVYLRDTQTSTTRLLDAGTDGVGSGVSPAVMPAMSTDGRFLAFDCPDGRIVADDRNLAEDVFMHNVTTGVGEMISVRHPDLPSQSANAASGASSISVSSNGLYIAFISEADNLTANDTNRFRDVYVRDVLQGTNILVSANTNGMAGSGFSSQPAISGNGRYVAFTSMAGDLVAGYTSYALNYALQVFVRDLQSRTTTLVSAAWPSGWPGMGDSYLPTIGGDGRFVLYRSTAQNLAPGPFFPRVGYHNCFLRDRETGTNYALTTLGLTGAAMTPDGRYVAYSTAFDSNPGSALSVFVWDSLAATRIYTNTPFAYPSTVTVIAISPDGQRVAYIAGDSPFTLNVADRAANTNWVIGGGPFPFPLLRVRPRFSDDARFLVYSTGATNDRFNMTFDTYLYDFHTGTNRLVSRSYDSGAQPDAASDYPDISADGRFIAYHSFASNNVPNDFNAVPDLFLYDRANDATILASSSRFGEWPANNRSQAPVFSGDGNTLVFSSWASDVLAQDFNRGRDVFALQLASAPITDSDNDDMDDQWELDHFSTLARDGTGDHDQDGASDLNEYLAGTDPADPTSLFRVEIFYSAPTDSCPVVTWPVVSGKTYRVQCFDDPNHPAWQEMSGNVVFIGDRGYAYDLAPGAVRRFYRIALYP
jgi:Tol biopolymer transport system component